MSELSASRRADMEIQALIFYLSIERLFEKKVITATHFQIPGKYMPAEDVIVHPITYTQKNIDANAFNSKLLMIGSVLLTCDEALDDVFGQKNKDNSNHIANVHSVIHQLRNCFAHNPLNPKWVIFPKYQKKYEVMLSNGNIKIIDLTNLNNSPFMLGHVGGLNIIIGMALYAIDMLYKELGDEPA